MCEPTTLVATASAISTLSKGYSAYQQGKAAQARGEYDNQVAKYNARVTENEATRIRNKGTEEEIRLRNETERLVSRQRAALAARGVDIGSGTPLDLQEDSYVMGEADALRIRSNFEDQARVRDDQAELTRLQGEAAESAGRNAASAGRSMLGRSILGAGSTFVASGVADKWFSSNSMARGASIKGYTGDEFTDWLKRQ